MANAYLIIIRDASGFETYGIRAFADMGKAHVHACKASQTCWGDSVEFTIENDDDRGLALRLQYVNGGYENFWQAPETAAVEPWPSLEMLGIDTPEAKAKRWMDSMVHSVG